jgi:hypothetical protein
MVMLAEDEPYHVALLVREALWTWTAGQILAELGLGTLRYSDGWQFHGLPPLPSKSRMILDSYYKRR